MKKQTLLFFCVFVAQILVAQVTPLPNAHAHNDYEHPKPLFDALSQGFCSVEADVHLMNGELYVAHNTPAQTSSSITLEHLYLNPLQKIIKQNKGTVYPGFSGVFYLMIDFKTTADGTYEVLKEQLKKYPEFHNNPHFVIFISGNRPIDKIRNEAAPAASLDGRPQDLGKSTPVKQMPVVSDSFSNVCQWDGKGTISNTDRQKLQTLAKQVHAEGKKLRLWATPDQPAAWKVLMESGVDFINTDKLEDLRRFLEKNSPVRN